jgi:hypothetical protein
MKKQIEVFEKEYEELLMLAGSDDKIAFAVRNVMAIIQQVAALLNRLSGVTIIEPPKEHNHEP